MERLTYRDEHGVIRLAQEFESLEEALLITKETLFVREEIEEIWKQGCEYCKGVTKKGAIMIGDDFGMSLNYCPMCGRKLVK